MMLRAVAGLRGAMHTYTVSRRVVQNDRQQQKRIGTLQHIRRGWIPFRPDLALLRLERMRDGTYARSGAALSADAAQDLSFFSWCARFLGSRPVTGQEAGYRVGFNPLVELEYLSETELRQLLAVHPEHISTNRFQQWSKLHLAFSEHAEAAKAFAISLCDAADGELEEPTVTSTVLLEELGWQLFVWNYPHLLHSLVRRKLAPQQLESAFVEMFGYSPSLLARELGAQWKLSDVICDSLTSQPPPRPIPPNERAKRQLLRTAKEATATFAAAHCPAMVRIAQPEVEKQIRTLLEPYGLDMSSAQIVRSAEDRFEEGKADLHRSIEILKRPAPRRKPTVTPEAPPRAVAPTAVAPTAAQPSTTPEFLEIIQGIYHHLSNGSDHQLILRELIERAAPAAGFSEGCIFLNSGDGKQLIPTLALTNGEDAGRRTLRRALSAARMSSDNPLPLTEQVVLQTGEMREMISGAFGTVSQQGVLWLEVDPERLAAPNYDGRRYFNMIRQCLEDCLSSKAASQEG